MNNKVDIENSGETCVIIPTYNNASTLANVVADVLRYIPHIILVDDGSTDATGKLLQDFKNIEIISYHPNRGKGYALKKGFALASSLGFRYAITIDVDGQHLASDIPLFLEQIKKTPDSLIIGSRYLEQENVPKQNRFANRFSNFWFKIHTLKSIPDTQSGFRLYPLVPLKKIKIFSTRYEMELELLVRSVWNFIPLVPIKISVYYPPQNERVSHFKPFQDFFRISILNTFLTFFAFFYFYPKFLFKKIRN